MDPAPRDFRFHGPFSVSQTNIRVSLQIETRLERGMNGAKTSLSEQIKSSSSIRIRIIMSSSSLSSFSSRAHAKIRDVFLSVVEEQGEENALLHGDGRMGRSSSSAK
jgi:hypothetical protein